MNNSRYNTNNEREKQEKQVVTAQLIRWSGLAAVAAGIIFAGIQPVHPPDVVESVTTPAWIIINSLKTVMCFLFLLGIAGIYARQVKNAGWLGLAGFLMFSFCWWLQAAFVFAETFIFPVLAKSAPQFVDGFLGLVAGRSSEVELGAIPILYGVGVGGTYLLGGILFGITTFRTGILPRSAALLLTITALLTPAAALLPHQVQRLAAMPMGWAIAWLGFALWFERHYPKAQPEASSIDYPVQQTLIK